MPRRRSVTGPPRSYLIAGQWPNGDVGDHEEAAVAQAVARALTVAIGDRSLRDVARACGLDRGTVTAVLRGETWGDLHTLARLEATLGVPLWPGLGR
jgi:predicted lysophospholipase L1 biosynthesis ABC-type transport system permease subunit